MGTNANQIATRNDIDSGKRINAYEYSKMDAFTNEYTKCPTKGEINQIEFLDVKNTSAITTENTYWNVGSAYWSNYGSMKLGPNNTTVNSNNTVGIPITPPNYENYPLIIPSASSGYYHSSSTYLFNISFDAGVDNIDFYKFDDVKANSLCYKTISVTPDKYTNLRINYAVIAYANTTSPQRNYSVYNVVTPQNDNKQFGITIALVDSNSKVINVTDVNDFVATNSYINISFTPSTNSITIYIIPRYIDVSFYPKVPGNLYVGVGFNLGVTKTIYDSYYDSDSKLAQYKDIGTDSSRKFDIYVGVWNNKSSNADVEYARVYINTSNSHTATGWTQVGSTTFNGVSSQTSKLITCTLPTNIDLGATQYYLMIEVGATTFKQTWSGGWGPEYNTTTYTPYNGGDGYRGRTTIIPLTPAKIGGDSVLNIIDVNGESVTAIKGIYNANPELKGWIKIS